MRLRSPLLLGTAILAVAACGDVSSLGDTPSPTASPSPSSGPDRETITVVAGGTGDYELATIPVALLHNDSARHGASQVVVHFVTRNAHGGRLGALDSVAVNLAPGETLPVAGDCTDACTGAATTDASVTVGAWVDAPGVSFTGAGTTYRCEACGQSNQHGDVVGTVAVPHLGEGAAVALFAACQDASEKVVGGGLAQIVWPGGRSLAVDVPVLLSAAPARCSLGASAGW